MKELLFDFGGTIDTDGVHWSEKFWDWYQQFNINVTKQEYERAFVSCDDDLLNDPHAAAATFHATLKMQAATQFRLLGLNNKDLLIALVEALYDDVTETIAKASELIREVKPRYKLGLVSNFYGNLEVVTKEFGLDRLFDVAIDSAVVGVRKPDPEIFGLALRKLDIVAGDAIVIGDSYDRDIEPAKKLGCRTVWLKGRSWTDFPTETPAADVVIGRFEELKEIL